MNRRILVIDDEHADLIANLIALRLPIKIDEALSVQEAQVLLNQNCYDLIVLDVNLPGEEGITVAQRILERDPAQPILIVTAYAGAHIKENIERLQLPHFDKLEMSGGQEVFCRKVCELLEQRPCERAGEARGADEEERKRRPGKNITLMSPIQIHARSAGFMKQRIRTS